MNMFISNSNLIFIQEQLNYKNIDEIQTLLTKLLDGKIMQQTKILNIHLIIAKMALKNIIYTI